MGRASGSLGVDTHAVDEVVHSATNRIHGNTDDRAPMNAVARAAVYDIVRVAGAFEAAIRPGNVHRTCAVNGGGRKTGAAQAARLHMTGSARNAYRRGPALAAVGGHEGRHASVVVSKPHYN